MSASYNYTQLVALLQAWPVNNAAEYIANIPNMVNNAESQLYKDCNFEFFDVLDSSFLLTVGNQMVTKPAGLIQVNSMRVALITGTVTGNADPDALVLTSATFENMTSLPLNGAFGPAPATLSPAPQVTVTAEAGASGISVVVTGVDAAGYPLAETIITQASGTILGSTRFAIIQDISVFGGDPTKHITVGIAAVTANTLGQSWNVDHRSPAWCDDFNSDPAVVGRPRYYSEYSQTAWQLTSSADQSYAVVVRFIKRPQSIVDSGVSWFGTNAGELLFYASLMQAERFLKADDRWDDMMTDYQQALARTKAEMSESIRNGRYSPYRPAAEKAQ